MTIKIFSEPNIVLLEKVVNDFIEKIENSYIGTVRNKYQIIHVYLDIHRGYHTLVLQIN